MQFQLYYADMAEGNPTPGALRLRVIDPENGDSADLIFSEIKGGDDVAKQLESVLEAAAMAMSNMRIDRYTELLSGAQAKQAVLSEKGLKGALSIA